MTPPADMDAEGAAALPDTQADQQARVAAADKVLQTWRARFALAGFELHIVVDDGQAAFLVSRWGLVRRFSSLAALEAFAKQVGVRDA